MALNDVFFLGIFTKIDVYVIVVTTGTLILLFMVLFLIITHVLCPVHIRKEKKKEEQKAPSG